jgi:hypothetical protein
MLRKKMRQMQNKTVCAKQNGAKKSKQATMLRKKMRQMQNKTVCAKENGAKKVSEYA